MNPGFSTWLVIAAATITPLTWFGSPKDFWYDKKENANTEIVVNLFIQFIH